MADKRTRSDSSAAAVQAMKNAAVDTIDPPSHAGLEKKPNHSGMTISDRKLWTAGRQPTFWPLQNWQITSSISPFYAEICEKKNARAVKREMRR